MVNLPKVATWKQLIAATFYLAVVSIVPTEAATNRFGFSGPEIFPIDNQIGQLHAGDIDGDGKVDLVLVNNSRAKINILRNQTGKTNSTPVNDGKKELNELPPGSRFRIDSIASEKRISGLVLADLNGDAVPDLAYYGEPKELVVQYNNGTNGWSVPKRFPIDDAQLTPNALTTGDLNGDKLTDILLLAENYVHFIPQKADHTFGEDEKIPFTGSVKAVQVLDIDGDGRDDLLLVNWDDPNPFRFRLQHDDGQLGPEIYFSLPAIRSYWADDLDHDHKTEIITISQNSGRAQVSNFSSKPAEALGANFKQGQFQILPFNKTSKARRGMLWADVNSDGLADLLIAQPDSGQLTLYLQKKDASLAAPKTFPTLTGISDLAVADWDGDGTAEIFLLSPDERQIGLTRFDKNGRIPFPTILPLDGKPMVMAVGQLDAKSKPVLTTILEQENRRVIVTRSADGKTRSQRLSESFKSNPTSMAIHDVDQDGAMDLVVLVPYEKMKILRQIVGKDFEELDIAPPGGNAEQPWLSMLDVDGDGKSELLLAQKNFLRAVVLKPEAQPVGTKGASKTNWAFNVKEQINGSANNSRIVGATAVSSSSNSIASLFLLDAEKKVLTLSERDKAGVWQVVRNTPLPMTDFNEIGSVGIGSTNQNCLAFLGVNSVAWMPLTGRTWELVEFDGYETPIKDGHLNDVISGDLNNDGRKDLVLLETAKNYVDLVTYEPPHQLVPANRWPVFEERTFRSRRSDMPEPREALIVDVTGDGKNDLVVLVHDRILIYPQE